MADNTIKVGIQVSDGGSSAKTTKNVENLKDVLDQTQASAAKTSKTLRAMSGAAPGSATTSKLRQASEIAASQSYGQARGAIGTGAEGRDFAKQSQGLGGLVRLYATYAANVFAVSAAFTALSNAMNTSNMVQGLNQLGAASGVALGSLAKQFTQVSGGAISLRESMEATTKAISSGLSTEQFLKLGNVAKTASQALGINMSDAVSRLTRGITKLEPELLDELGIFTKVGKSTEDYARSVGKSVTALTDFEKRQAFANAVLAEGTKKFSEINIPTNPYDKLLASLKNIAQQILEVINKGLTPLVSLLSESPRALTAIIGLLAATIIKQALPAIGQYRAGLSEAAESSRKLFDARAADAKKTLDVARAAKAKEIKLELDNIAAIKTARVDEEQRNLQAIAAGQGITKRAQQILRPSRPIQDITEKQLKYIEEQGKKQTVLAGTYRALAISIREAQRAEEDYQRTAQRLEKQKLAAPGMFSPAGRAASQAESARRKSASLSIISQAGESASTAGFFGSLGKITESIKTEKLGLIRGAFTGIAAGANAAATAIGGILSVASKFLGYIGIAITVFQLLSSVLSKNSAEVEKFNSSLDTLTEATKTATDVQAKYGNTVSVESILAKSTALTTLSGSIKTLTANFQNAQDAASWFDNFIDALFIPLGKDVESKFANQLSSSIIASLDSITDPKTREAAENQIKRLLGLETIDFAGLQKSVKGSTKEVTTGLQTIIDTAKDAESKLSAPLQIAAEGLEALDKSFVDLSNSLINKDPITKFAIDLLKSTEQLSTAFNNPQTRIAELKKLLEDTSRIKMFPPETQAGILEAARNVVKLTQDIKTSQEQIEQAKIKIAASKSLEAGGAAPEVYLRIRMEGEALFGSATELFNLSTKKLDQINFNLTKGLAVAAQQAFQLIEAPLVRAYAQAGIETQKTLLGFLPKTPQAAELSAKLEVQSIELRKQEISAVYNLTAALDKDRLSRERIALQEQATKLPEGSQQRKDIDAQIALVQQQIAAYAAPKALLQSKEPLSSQASEIIARGTGLQTQLIALSNQQKNALIKGLVDSIGAGFAISKEIQQRELETIKQENINFFSSDAFQQLTPAQQTTERAARTAQETTKAQQIDQLGPQEKIAVAFAIQEKSKGKILELSKQAVTAAQSELASMQGVQASVLEVANTEASRTAKFEELTAAYEKQKLDSETTATIFGIQNQLAQDSLAAQQQELEYLSSIGVLTKDQYAEQKRLNELKQIDLETTSKLFTLLTEYVAKQRELGLQMADPKNAGNLQALAGQAAANAQIYAQDTAAAAQSADLKRQSIQLTKDVTSRTTEYGRAFESTVMSMSDALVDFALTGKQSFGDMIESMIVGLIKFETQMMITKAFSGAGGFEGIAGSIVGALFGTPTPSGATTGASMMSNWNPASPIGNATFASGGGFNAGVQMFAKGGAFTNTVVTKPTMFAFAKGAGVMGEAGPEAIMPLKRGANGSLGVQGGQPANVEVVVNNYGSEKATTKETTDSRGNRRIEVQIGDMVATEMQRPNSAMQGTMRNTFGVAPMLTRR